VAAEGVHHDDVGRAQFRHPGLLDPGLDDEAVDWRVDRAGRDDTAVAHAGDQRGGLPVPVRHRHAQAITAQAASVWPGHVGAGPAFIDEDQAFGIEIGLSLELGFTPARDVRAALLGRGRRPLLRV